MPPTHYQTNALRAPVGLLAGVLAAMVLTVAVGLAWTAFGDAPSSQQGQGVMVLFYGLMAGFMIGMTTIGVGLIPWLGMHFTGARGWKAHLALGVFVGLAFFAYMLMTGRTNGAGYPLGLAACLILGVSVWLTAWRVMYRLEPVVTP